jgi:hypothetical protein
MDITEFDLHDSVVTSFISDGAILRMAVEHVSDPLHDNDESQHNLALIFKNVTSIKIDGISVNNLENSSPEGTVLRFGINNHHAKFFIEWVDYKARTNSFSGYEFNFASLEIDEF